MSELYDEPSISGKQLVVIRWNPHSYVVPPDKKRLTLDERLQVMVALKQRLRSRPPDALITVFYVCYSADNPHIIRGYPSHFVYGLTDVTNAR